MKLAINGGKAIINKPFPDRNLYNKEVIKAKLSELIDSDNLSGYRGSFGQHFWGGKNVRELESFFENWIYDNCSEKVKVLTINSCTSALQVACGAIGLQAGDEVIVSPWSMTCSATAPMVYGATPVFADIEKDYFCLDVNSIEKKITDKTKAIIAVDLFGQPYDRDQINELAKKYNLFIIEDTAQALGSTFNNKQAGTLGDIGCFSFTQGKHFTCGEGGFIVTKNPDLYNKCALIRNHAESVINSMPENIKQNWLNMRNQYGFNLRMTEMQAVILQQQLKHIYTEINKRRENVNFLKENIIIPGLMWAKEREKVNHSYYVLPFTIDDNKLGISRNKFIEAVKAELRYEKTEMGITQKIDGLIWEKYITPLYKMPIFSIQDKYKNIELPNVEKLQNENFCFTSYQALELNDEYKKMIVNAFYKVYENKDELNGVL